MSILIVLCVLEFFFIFGARSKDFFGTNTKTNSAAHLDIEKDGLLIDEKDL